MVDLFPDSVVELRLYIMLIGIVLVVGMMFAERTKPEKIPFWTVIFLAFPILGFVAWLIVGQTFYAEHTFRLKGVSDKELREAQRLGELTIDEDSQDLDPEVLRTIKALKRVGALGYTNNNDVTLYTDGNEFFDRMLEDIRAAKEYIHLEYFILRNDELGRKVMGLLMEKAREGVRVRVVVDYLGLDWSFKKVIRGLKRAGGEFATFHRIPVLLFSPKKNNRNHRKITVVDGYIGYCGGFNIGDEYLGKGKFGNWRDSGIRVVGGGCLPLNIRFLMDWNYAVKKSDAKLEIKAHISEHLFDEWGEEKMQVVSGGPDVAWKNPVRLQYLEMIRMARKRIWLHTPYLIPDDSLVDGLTLAAASGVDVRVIIPDKPDHILVYWNNLYSANKLMEGGVRVYHYNDGFVHSKTMLVDDCICSIGSANLDDRSLVHNFETNVIVYSETVAKGMEDAYLSDLEKSTEYSCERYGERTFGMKVRISVSRLFKTLS